MHQYSEGDNVGCKVLAIGSATVTVETDEGTKGSIAMSEVAAGRIRNIREYVVVNKRIVCKVLAISKDHLELSLRRVTGKEREEIENQRKKERTLFTILKSITKNHETIITKILEKTSLAECYDAIKANPETIKPFVTKEEAEKIISAFSTKDTNIKECKTIVVLTTQNAQGVDDIKTVMTKKEAKIMYLGSGKFAVSTTGSDFKKARYKLEQILTTINQEAKEKKIACTIKEII
jgi:translation initiation factor 2 alpha subunit (eIF-2alpha)